MKIVKVLMSIALVTIVVFGFAYSLVFEFKNNSIPENDVNLDDKSIYVHYIDVGQGDCALIQTSSGNVLIDAGTFDSRYDIIDYVDELGISVFDYAIFTHPHEDHIGGAKVLLDEFEFKNVIMPDAVHTTPAFLNMVDAVEKEKCEVFVAKAGDSYTLGEVKIDVFAPDTYYDSFDLNNMSIVCKITYGEVSFLFTGDAEEESEDSMRYYKYELDSDVLKVAHHGSSTSSTDEFINEVSPEIAIISAGKNNDYGHPHRETMQLLNKLDIKTYITYEVGSVVVSTDGTDYAIQTEK